MTLDDLVGEWSIEARHPSLPGQTVAGRAASEWLEGGKFLIQRSWAEHADFPDSISILGEFEDGLASHYYDSRGVHRIYAVELGDGEWRMARDAPGFSQRFTGRLQDGGRTIEGLWTLSRDGETFDNDLEITFRRQG